MIKSFMGHNNLIYVEKKNYHLKTTQFNHNLSLTRQKFIPATKITKLAQKASRTKRTTY